MLQNKSCIIVDSSSGIVDGTYNNVYMIPLYIIKDENGIETQLKDLIDLDTKQLIDCLQNHPNIKFKSSQSALGEMIAKIDELSQTYKTFYIWPISRGLSGSIATWEIAKSEFPDLDINIIDSPHINIGIKEKVIEISKMIDDNKSKEEILNFAKLNDDKWFGMLNVSDITQLKNGGRINFIKAFFVEKLKLNIIIQYYNSLEYLGYEKNFDKSIDKMLDYIDKKNNFKKNGIKKAYIYSTYIDDKKNSEIKELISQKLHFEIKDIYYFPAVIALHTGASTFGIYIESN